MCRDGITLLVFWGGKKNDCGRSGNLMQKCRSCDHTATHTQDAYWRCQDTGRLSEWELGLMVAQPWERNPWPRSVPPARRRKPACRALDRLAGPEQRLLVERPSDQLQGQRQAVRAQPAGD